MIKSLQPILLFCASLVTAWPLVLPADEIYHWVDDQGVNHYSQSPPPDSSSDIRTLDVDGSQPASYDPNEDRYNVAAQAEATQAIRDKLAEDRKNKQLAEQNAPENTVIYYPQEESYSEILYPPGYRPRPPNWRPGNKPGNPGGRPTPPIAIPPVAPPSRPLRPRGG